MNMRASAEGMGHGGCEGEQGVAKSDDDDREGWWTMGHPSRWGEYEGLWVRNRRGKGLRHVARKEWMEGGKRATRTTEER
jgi:hypothetical protein